MMKVFKGEKRVALLYLIKRGLKKEAGGGVTIFAALIFMVVCSLTIVLIRSAVFIATVARIDSSCALASESAFAGYSNKVFDKYGIFVLRDSAGAFKRADETLRYNMADSPAHLQQTFITGQTFMTDNGGEPFYDQVTDYMMVEGTAESVMDVFGELKDSKKIESVENIGKMGDKFSKIADENLDNDGMWQRINDLSDGLGESKKTSAGDDGVFDGMKRELDKGVAEAIEAAKTPIDPENVPDDRESRNLFSAFRNIQKILTGKVTSLVLTDESVSGKKADTSGWAPNLPGNIDSRDLAKDLAFNEYLFLKFDSYTDIGGVTGANKPDYELEYILNGKLCDRENIDETMSKILALRHGLNILWLITNPEKSAEAEALAAGMFAFTLNPLIIKAGKYAVMAAWSYGESICDLKLLYTGKKVPVYKSENTWSLSLGGLLKGSLDPEASKGNEGQNYEMYLRLLLSFVPSGTRTARAMDVIEMNMKNMGDRDFRMRECIFSQVLNAKFTLPYGGRDYSAGYECAYSGNMVTLRSM